jgi:succinate-acetate transporter protein
MICILLGVIGGLTGLVIACAALFIWYAASIEDQTPKYNSRPPRHW